MFNIFKRKKKSDNSEPQENPIEIQIATLVKENLNYDNQISEIDLNHLGNELKKINKGTFISLCNNRDLFPISILFSKEISELSSLMEQLHELTGLEPIQYEYEENHYSETMWTHSDYVIHCSPQSDYFILTNDYHKESASSNILKIHHNKEFLLGQLLIGDLSVKGSLFSMVYSELDFSPGIENNDENSYFQSSMKIDNSNIDFHYCLKGKNKYIGQLAKELIKDQKSKFETQFSKSVSITKAGPVDSQSITTTTLFSIKGIIHTSGINIPFLLFFPKSIVKLFPQYFCRTIKGNILQINKELMRIEFDNFYKSKMELLFDDFLAIAENRDLNLICQNFFLSNSINADKLRELFYYKIKLDEKTKVLKIPFISQNPFTNHLPIRLRESFKESKSFSQNYDELIDANRDILELIYRNESEGNLLLSYKTKYILDRELGSKERENKTRRLKKLVGNKKYINYLSKIDNKKAQVLLSNMKNILIADTFIYQTDELIKLKPYLSKNRFNELREDITFTQGKIKTNQIDVNRICDSIEKFNDYIKEFARKEREKET